MIDRLTDFSSIHWWIDALDILLVLFLLFQLYKFVRGTAAIRIFVGAIGIYALWKTTQYLNMELLSDILGQFIGVGVIALIVVFQQEIRKFLLLIASPKIYNRFAVTKWMFKWRKNVEKMYDFNKAPILEVCQTLSDQKIGALIVISTEYDLDAYKSLGVPLDAELSSELLESIFHKESPLHDGAVIISSNRIVAARCVLPVSDRQDLPGHMGLRHRAAIGVTENSGAIAVVVSEQNGNISICKTGKLRDNLSLKKLSQLLNFNFLPG